MIFTQPVGAQRTLRECRLGEFRAETPKSPVLLMPLLGRKLAGIGLSLAF
jgi:hypothetical protein